MLNFYISNVEIVFCKNVLQKELKMFQYERLNYELSNMTEDLEL